MAASVATFVAAPANATNSDHKVGICHATGSKTNPYVYIVVDQHAAEAHKNHQDGRDVIGVSSADKCPKAATATPAPAPSKGGEVKGDTAPTPTPGKGGGVVLPATLPDTGAEQLSMLIGLPAMAAAGAAYLRSRKQ
jgi:LPXTG-motif cell wall-anchored protein